MTIRLASAAIVLFASTAAAAQSQQKARDACHEGTLRQYQGTTIKGRLAAYVESVGRRLMPHAGIPGANVRFYVLDSPIANATACSAAVYISREYISLLNDEAQLASVLGHELGHIAAGHTRSDVFERIELRGNRQQALLGTLIDRMIGFSHGEEFEADKRGLQMAAQAGYDPEGAVDEHKSMALYTRFLGRGGGNMPEGFWSTHPSRKDRVTRLAALAKESGRAGQGVRNRDRFLLEIEGTAVGATHGNGVIVFEHGIYVHPTLRFAFDLPSSKGQIRNNLEAVLMTTEVGHARFSIASDATALEQAVLQRVDNIRRSNPGVQFTFPTPQIIRGRGVDAAYSMGQASGSEAADVGIMAYRLDRESRIYLFASITRPETGFGPFERTVTTFRRPSTDDLRKAAERRIKVVTVRNGETLETLASRMPYTKDRLERLLVLNGFEQVRPLTPGEQIKVIEQTPSAP